MKIKIFMNITCKCGTINYRDDINFTHPCDICGKQMFKLSEKIELYFHLWINYSLNWFFSIMSFGTYNLEYTIEIEI